MMRYVTKAAKSLSYETSTCDVMGNYMQRIGLN